MNSFPRHTLFWVILFSAGFGFVESSVVVYLRAIYYPEGFQFPLKPMSTQHFSVELLRETSTIVMLAAVAILSGSKNWERFAWFLIAFGVWDIFYYIWLKVLVDWPVTLLDWDILFLVPLPWIGPVIAPVAISMVMIVCGVWMIARLRNQRPFAPRLLSRILASAGSAVVLFSFLYDTDAPLRNGLPRPYQYSLLLVGLLHIILAFVLACRPSMKRSLHD